MDLLDGYKKAWDNQPEETNKVSKVDIYKMAHSRSSSIVKWIFIIGILEFLFIVIINFVFRIDPEYYDTLNNFFGKSLIWIDILSYGVTICFLILFYKNYKNISISDDTKTLMTKITKTRKTVKAYVFFNLSLVFLISIIVLVYSIYNNEFNQSGFLFYATIIVVSIFLLAIFIGIYWLFYQLLYGILLRKLNKNYKELAKLEEFD